MTSEELQIIQNTKAFVQTTLKNAEGGHDWFHIQRVFKLAETIAVLKHFSPFFKTSFV
mgnify:CR=1 FL=1